MKPVNMLNSDEAKEFFLRTSSYCSIGLPPYFDFTKVLHIAENIVNNSNRGTYTSNRPGDSEKINHRLLTNKDGSYSWRALEIINPILYVELVKLLTEKKNWEEIGDRIKLFQSNPKIECVSMPLAKNIEPDTRESIILNWWEEFEQQSIALSLDFTYISTTDITDCYSSIYTHSIAWALHSQETAKKNRKKTSLVGNKIDDLLQDVHNRQTNSIPQGNKLSDFLAEIILGYSDFLLTQELEKAKIESYKILRYRDDYRIFTNTAEDGRQVLLYLTQVLSSLNLRLNKTKTSVSNDIITSSIKPDKISWLKSIKSARNLQKSLLLLREFGLKYPNSGALISGLGNFRKRLEKTKKIQNHNDVLIAIIVDIMLKSPNTYPTGASILSKLLAFENEPQIGNYLNRIRQKFSGIPNIGILDLWLQRISLKYDSSPRYSEELCTVVETTKADRIWNFDWLSKEARSLLESASIIDSTVLEEMGKVMSLPETELFLDNFYGLK